MIPNNQLWFRQSGTAFPPIETGYEYVAEWRNLSPTFSERDGIVLFETNGKLRMIGGWNGTWTPFTTNEQWESADGITWTQIADAPWVGRHSFANGFRNDGKFWIWGGDDQQTPGTAQTDVWTYDSVNGWIQVTSNWGLVAGNRQGYSFCIHNNYMYLIGGTNYDDCVRSNDGITWTKMSDLPLALGGLQHGYAVSHRGDIYIVGGFPGNQNKVYKSSDHGATWTSLPDLTLDGWQPTGIKDSTAWCRMVSWSDRIFYIAGASTGGNVNGMWYTEDGALTWKKMYSFPVRPRHATDIKPFGNDLYVVSGNNAIDSNRVYKTPLVTLADKAIYSVRKANASYNGPCMRVRDAFGAEADIGFSGNNLDTAALTTATHGVNTTVKTWYDQSGNGNHMTQSDPSKQPFIYLSAGGGIQMLNGKPAIYFFDSSKGLQTASPMVIGHHYVISFVAAADQNNRQILGNSATFDDYGIWFNTGSAAISHKSTNPDGKYFGGGASHIYVNNQQYITQLHRNRMVGRIFLNGTSSDIGTSTFERYDTELILDMIGREGLPFTGFLQEVIIRAGYHEFDTATAIEADINGYFATH